MNTRNYLTCLWPGLSELWWLGRLSALPLAIGFAIVLNSLLVLRFLYPTWLDPLLVRLACYLVFISWICWTIKSAKELPKLLQPRLLSETPDRFPDAHQAYLQADWPAAEKLLLGVLAIEPRDPPALLLLSGVYRHTGRPESAAALIDQMRLLEIADPWRIEIEAEMARIRRDRETSDHGPVEDQESSANADSDAEKRVSGDEDQGPSCAADLTAA
ncbi:tetratricopeptide repeat protein [Roseiconus nitratireducens]|uniref:Tetratricopeptide repeat protein n=1 Tax=Roseiconus nitratireducens TaxID=2605748 RepID=A0A5M6DLK2_9BACT|nr:tetratricopeptide repeat protein [Roseiconus nitratireducens]KAA5547132.1 tetratricopeptide repeat protein [Roseiconus nitratireducens]